MPEKTPQDYANELLQMYRDNAKAIKDIEIFEQQIVTPQPSIPQENVFEDGTGGMQVNVTTLSRLYPVKNALVTVFTGTRDNMTVIETDITNESGQSGVFNLKTPPLADSQQAENNGQLPYASYNVSVRSDGYVEQIAMNVPVFSGIISVQGIDLLPVSAAGSNTAPQTTNQANEYNL